MALGALAGLAAVGLSAWASHAAPVRLEPQRLAMLASGARRIEDVLWLGRFPYAG